MKIKITIFFMQSSFFSISPVLQVRNWSENNFIKKNYMKKKKKKKNEKKKNRDYEVNETIKNELHNTPIFKRKSNANGFFLSFSGSTFVCVCTVLRNREIEGGKTHIEVLKK